MFTEGELSWGYTYFLQLIEEIAAKEEEDSNIKPKGKEEKKGKQVKGKNVQEVSAHISFN